MSKSTSDTRGRLQRNPVIGGFRQLDVEKDKKLDRIREGLSGTPWRAHSRVLSELPLRTPVLLSEQSLEAQLKVLPLDPDFMTIRDRLEVKESWA